jgi:hypothetical protein
MREIKIVYILICCMFAGNLFGQSDMDVKTFTAEDGVLSFSQSLTDSQGYTWFYMVSSNEKMIYRYDGRQFKGFHVGSPINSHFLNFNRNNRRNMSMLRDSKGFIWIGTTKGVFKIANGKPHRIFSKSNGLLCDTIVSLAFDKEDNLWILTMNDLSIAKYEHGKRRLVKMAKEYSIRIRECMNEVLKNNKKLIKGFVSCDLKGNVWWGLSTSLDSTTRIYCAQNYFKANKKVSQIKINDCLISEMPLRDGLLFVSNRDVNVFCNSNGETSTLDKKFTRFLGSNLKGDLYFTTKYKDDKFFVFRDNPRNVSEFGSSDKVFVYPPMNIKTLSVYKVQDEFWFLDIKNENHGFVIKENKLFNMDSLYPSLSLKKIQLFDAGNDVFWGHKWQNQISVQIAFKNNSNLESLDMDVNGCGILDYESGDSAFFLRFNRFFPSKRGNLVLKKNGKLKILSNHLYDLSSLDYSNYERKGHHFWFFSSTDKVISHLENYGNEKTYSLDAYSRLVIDMTGNGCFTLKDSNHVYYLLNGKFNTIHITGKISVKEIFSSHNENIYLQSADDKIYSWNPYKNNAPIELKGLPTGKFVAIAQDQNTFSFIKGRQNGWIHNGKVVIIDTVVYPNPSANYFILQNQDRTLVYCGNGEDKYVKDIRFYQNQKYTIFPLIDSVRLDHFTVAINTPGSDELIYIDGSKIYRYNKQLQKFYFIKNVGRNFGYVWSAFVVKNTLHITGWSRYHLKIDLNNCPVTFPPLSFTGFRKNGKEIAMNKKVTLAYGDDFLINYIAIEAFNQSKIFYQTRIIGIDSSWTEESKNEVKELMNLRPGKYRFEVRTKGDSEIWSEPVGFDIVVLTPWYYSIIAYIAYCFFAILFIWMIVKLNSKRLRIANKYLEDKIELATSEIRHQKLMVEEHQKELIDSIKYAKRIQEALLPGKRYIDKNIERLKKK